MKKPRAVVNATRANWDYVFRPRQREALRSMLDLVECPAEKSGDGEHLSSFVAGAEVIVSTWGAAPLTAEVLDLCPGLRLVVHAAGSVKSFATEELRHRGIIVGSAARENGRPVAEYCLGLILCSLRNTFLFNHLLHEGRSAAWYGPEKRDFQGGYYRTKVGLIEFGYVARQLLQLLRPFNFEVHVVSDYFGPAEEKAYGARRATLEWVMAHCDVVSLHAADTPANHHLIHAGNLRLMKPGARLINTARGRLICEADLAAKLREGTIWAFLDVAETEPPPDEHPFYGLPNCVLTPHISGAAGAEIERLGDYCVREVGHYLAGESLENPVDLSRLATMA